MAYPPPYYTDDDPAYAPRIMAEHSFALLVVDGLDATHLPLIFQQGGGEKGGLEGHMSRQNPIAERLLSHAEPLSALAVFSGPHGYVSANLYDKPDASVPTWNYASVQVRGRLERMPDEDSVEHLQRLAETYEGLDGWSVDQASDYVAAIQRGIITVRVEIESVQAFRKMSGNKPPAIQKRIIDAAREAGEHAFADEMMRSLSRKESK